MNKKEIDSESEKHSAREERFKRLDELLERHPIVARVLAQETTLANHIANQHSMYHFYPRGCRSIEEVVQPKKNWKTAILANLIELMFTYTNKTFSS